MASPYHRKCLKIQNLQNGESSNSPIDSVCIDSALLIFVILNHFCHRTYLLQNGVAHMVTNNGICSLVKTILQNLHWLPVKCVHLNVLLTTYKCIYGETPKYLYDLLLIKKIIPTSLVIRLNSITFIVAGPILQNGLQGLKG